MDHQSAPRELTDAQLVERAVRNATEAMVTKWAAVMYIFGFGSTSAKALCRRFGFDPDESAHKATTDQPWGAESASDARWTLEQIEDAYTHRAGFVQLSFDELRVALAAPQTTAAPETVPRAMDEAFPAPGAVHSNHPLRHYDRTCGACIAERDWEAMNEPPSMFDEDAAPAPETPRTTDEAVALEAAIDVYREAVEHDFRLKATIKEPAARNALNAATIAADRAAPRTMAAQPANHGRVIAMLRSMADLAIIDKAELLAAAEALAASPVAQAGDILAMLDEERTGGQRKLKPVAQADALDAALAEAATSLVGFCEGVFGVMCRDGSRRWTDIMSEFRNYQDAIDAAIAAQADGVDHGI